MTHTRGKTQTGRRAMGPGQSASTLGLRPRPKRDKCLRHPLEISSNRTRTLFRAFRALSFSQKALLLGSLVWWSCPWCFSPSVANFTAADSLPREAVRCREFPQTVDPMVFWRQQLGPGSGCAVRSPTGPLCQPECRLEAPMPSLTAQALTGGQKGRSPKPAVEP